MVQLDGLRGIAVIMVIFHHWTSWGHALGLGNIGVQLFFVLSGFLITGILLDAREGAAPGRWFPSTFREFTLNRVARIWPIYILVLVAVALTGDRFERHEAMPMHFLFLSNVLFAIRGEFGTTLSHFWSIGVEQQFYLVWPFAVLLIDKKRLEWLTFALIASAPLFRLTMVMLGFENFASFNTLPFASMDSLGMGALISIWIRMPEAESTLRVRRLSSMAIAAAFAFALLRVSQIDTFNAEQTLYAIVFAWVVILACKGILGRAGQVLESRPLVAVGLVSYGVYVYHMFIPRAVAFLLRLIDTPIFLQDGLFFFLLCTVATITLAGASWFLIERPVINLRRSFRIQSTTHAI